MSNNVFNISEACSFPNGYTLSDNRIEDLLQRLISPSAYVVWRHYLRYWGGDKSTAYPSMASISKRTGLSEKTIRKCNKELCKKGFMAYTPGCSNRSNQYHYVPIDDLIEKYKDEIEGQKPNSTEKPPVKEIEKRKDSSIKAAWSNIPGCYENQAKNFFNIYKTFYKNKFGLEYREDKGDIQSLSKNAEEISENFSLYCELVDTFFSTRNKYVENSDYSMFLFFTPKVINNIVSEYHQTDKGRWTKQAEDEYNKIDRSLFTHCKTKEELKDSVKSTIRLAGANKARDNFVVDYIVDKIYNQ